VSKILVVDDEAAIRKVVRDALEHEGHAVETAAAGADAVGRLEAGGFDLLITDLNMPGMDGLELVRRVRRFSALPILILTVRQDERAKVRLLDSGADDYVTKPFGVAELLARTRALLRRHDPRTATAPLTRFGSVVVDRESRTVRKGDTEIHLTPTEYGLLLALLSKPGAVWTHRQLMSEVWGSAAGVTPDTLRVHMGSLRRKLEDDPNRPRFIRTEPWVGYRFVGSE
jgi:two-component system, OmpR family, KDP operon response regulator KdpE